MLRRNFRADLRAARIKVFFADIVTRQCKSKKVVEDKFEHNLLSKGAQIGKAGADKNLMADEKVTKYFLIKKYIGMLRKTAKNFDTYNGVPDHFST